jgi:hypothetical protein
MEPAQERICIMTKMTIDNIDRQRQYVEKQKSKSKGLGVVFADAFLRGMRDIGYKDPAWAISELVDNSMQAAASSLSIRFGFSSNNKSKTKPDQIAICDDGNGMIPEMISYAVRWGGTDREGDRSGFGRYGYGLPSSSVSLAKCYTVYAKAPTSTWHAVTVDIDKLAAAAGSFDETQALLIPRPVEPPTWVVKSAKGDDKLQVDTLQSGVVIVLEDLDRLNRLQGWIRCDSLKAKLLQHLGVVYRHFIPEKRIVVDGAVTEAVDPLFLMEHARLYSENSVLAERVETRTIEVEAANGQKGKVRLRASILPPNFPSADPTALKEDFRSRQLNKRYEIMRKYNGLLICRAGRHIDTISPRDGKFQNNDAYIKIEIDFDPVLDEYFSVTTAKQQIVIEEEMWEKLRNSGKSQGDLDNLIKDMRSRWKTMSEELKARSGNEEAEGGPRPSALAMEETEKFKPVVADPTPSQREEGERNLDEMASIQAKTSGRPKDVVREEIAEKARAKKWEVEFQAIPEGPFYRPYRLGEQKRVIINTEHPFYSRIYSVAGTSKHAVEVMLFVLAERELESIGDTHLFYKAERQRWSERLRHALSQLVSDESLADQSASIAEIMHSP